MLIFLLLISFFLNIVAFFFIIILFLRQNRFIELEKKQERINSEMEDLFSSYLIEMKEENDEFLKKIQLFMKTNKKPKEASEKKEEFRIMEKSMNDQHLSFQKLQAIKSYTTKPAKLEEEMKIPIYHQENHKDDLLLSSKKKAEPVSQESAPMQNRKNTDQTLFNQVKMLEHEGLSTEEIAKKLNKGKTEIELLLKFKQIRQ
ncbi:hypothetical protein [Bacillus sp. 03113]|uniref:hypothetical protein n=1 Tax=Bacillus sp. 03113 TaxID=2578211 RepID=UPI001144BE94|nr:hypothetical protein [Bacillus sp. 03113]